MTDISPDRALRHELERRSSTEISLRARLAHAVKLIDEQKARIAFLEAQWANRWTEANKEGE